MTTQPTPAQQLIGDFAPKLVELADNVLFGEVWERPGLSPRDRCLVTVTALASLYRTEQDPLPPERHHRAQGHRCRGRARLGGR
jgi:alkylhydroperoxidase/carboxymuconolactone decarboxylase family protein YurZ